MPTHSIQDTRQSAHATRAAAAPPLRATTRIDTAALKCVAPIEEVVARYGVDLHRSGRALVGRCPFHDDQGRPNLYLYPNTDSYYCYRCNVGGDAIDFVERIERVDFRGAVKRLAHRTAGFGGDGSLAPVPRGRAGGAPRADGSEARHGYSPGRHTPEGDTLSQGPAEQACLAAAVELYENRLRSDARGRAYVESRGLKPATVEGCRLGYARGDELADFLRWRRLPVEAARRAGLLTAGERDFLAGRVVVPEIRGGAIHWLVGRAIAAGAEPRYLGLRGKKPLLGWDAACTAPAVVMVEGVFDVLVLRQWDIPGLALVGTHARADVLAALRRFRRIYVALDRDAAGETAAAALVRQLAELAIPAVPVTLPALPGVKDVADLALHPDGQRLFAGALLRASRQADTAPAPAAA